LPLKIRTLALDGRRRKREQVAIPDVDGKWRAVLGVNAGCRDAGFGAQRLEDIVGSLGIAKGQGSGAVAGEYFGQGFQIADHGSFLALVVEAAHGERHGERGEESHRQEQAGELVADRPVTKWLHRRQRELPPTR
jgi:hypothetical protein